MLMVGVVCVRVFIFMLWLLLLLWRVVVGYRSRGIPLDPKRALHGNNNTHEISIDALYRITQ